jgi:hypothetical protein
MPRSAASAVSVNRDDLFGDEERMTGEAVYHPEREDRQTEGQRDRETTRPRDRPRMHAAAAGQVEHAEAFRQPADERCDRSRNKERDKSGADEEEAGHRAEL